MNKEKFNILIDIGMNLPRAGLEALLLASVPVGGLMATAGAGLSYLLGYPETAKGLLVGGIVGAGIGGIAFGLYSAIAANYGEFGVVDSFDSAIDNVSDGIERYQEAGKRKE